MAWLILVALLAISAVPIFTNLGRAQSADPAEAGHLALAVETWRNRLEMYHGDISLESLAPIAQGQPQLDQPPGFVWLDQLAFASLDPLTVTEKDLLYQGRLLTAIFGMLTLAAVFWAGFSVGGLVTASFSAMVCLSCPALVYFARSGTPQIAMVGLETLGIASAMWALRPLRPAPSLPRQGIGWFVCGAALGMAVLTAGPVAIPIVLGPILVISIMCPNRISHLLGLIAAIFIAALMVMPWAVYVHGQDTHIWERWVAALWPEGMAGPGWGRAVVDRGLLLLVLVLPWTLWLIGSLAQPFSASSSGVRRRVFIGWAWFLCVSLMVLTGPVDGHVGGLLPVLPAAAILIGQSLRLYSDRSAEARHARIWRFTRWPHLVLIGLASLALPAIMYFQSPLVDQGRLTGPIVATMPWYYWLGMGASLLMIWLLSLRYALRHYPGRTLVCWSMWVVVLMSVSLIPLTRGPLMNPPPSAPDPVPAEQTAMMPAES